MSFNMLIAPIIVSLLSWASADQAKSQAPNLDEITALVEWQFPTERGRRVSAHPLQTDLLKLVLPEIRSAFYPSLSEFTPPSPNANDQEVQKRIDAHSVNVYKSY